MRRLFWLALAAWLLGEWYMRGGRAFLLGERDRDQWEPGLETIREWTTIRPPSIRHTFTTVSALQLVGKSFGHDGETIGKVLAAERDDRGWLRVRYEADRAKLGYPVTRAVAQAELYLARFAESVAVQI